MADGWDRILIVSGLSLSALTMIVLGWMIVNCWRRGSMPAVSYGGLTLPEKRLRWIWILFLTGAFGFGVAEDPIFFISPQGHSEEAAAADPAEEVPPGTETLSWSLFAPLPFIRYERETERLGDTIVRDYRLWSFLIPTPLLAAMFAYLVLVVFWHPERTSARRLLLGKRAVRAEKTG